MGPVSKPRRFAPTGLKCPLNDFAHGRASGTGAISYSDSSSERREHYEQRIVVLESEARPAEHQLERVQDFKALCSKLAPRLDNLGFEERVKLVQAVVDSVTVDPENNVSIHIAVFPERLPVRSDVATVPIGTLIPVVRLQREEQIGTRAK